jgi:hypothetical protein
MSVLRSSEEREAAVARLREAPDDSLQRDLVDWTVATHVSAERWSALANELSQVKELHAEEEVWIELIATEIRRTTARVAIA